MTLPLDGVLVLDLSRVLAGPYATQLLGDLGAEVWKVERPGRGDETRSWGPPFVAGESAYFLSVNRNKRSAALDFHDPVHLATIRRAALAADVVVENFLPGALKEFGLDPASLRQAKPELIACSITGFGQDGPYAALPGYDAVLQGFTGLMSATGQPDGPATKVGVAIVDVLTGAHAAAAILAALVARSRHGVGSHIDIALFEVGVVSMVNVAQAAVGTGVPARRYGNAHPHIVPYQTFETADGPLVVAVGSDDQWRRLCAALDLHELGSDPRWAENPGRVLHRTEVVDRIAARLKGLPRATWLDRLRLARVPAGPVRDMVEAVRDPALAERGLLQSCTLAEPEADLETFGLPWRLDGSRPSLRYPPPRLGQHTEAFRQRFA